MHRRSAATAIVAAMALTIAPAAASLAVASESVRTFTATLSGDEEVPPEGEPPVETTASGDATFEVSADGTEISYSVNVADLENVEMAHIHLGARGENGPVIVWLYPDSPPPELIEGTSDGELASGTISADSLVDELEGGTIDDLVNEMVAGNTYVNVHTEQYPAGEIRGQIVAGDDAIAQPDRVDTGAGGAAGSTNIALLAVAGLTAAAMVGAIAVRRRVSAFK